MTVETKADHRPDVYREDGKWVFRASSFGSCDASLVRQAMGMTPNAPPDVILNAYEQGVKFEPVILGGIAEYGWRMLDPMNCGDYGRVDETGQLLVELQVGPNAVVRCHPDGIAQCFKAALNSDEHYGVGARRVIEAKALKAGAWDRPLEKRQYAWQMSIEMVATGLPGAFVVGWKHPTADGGVEVRREHVDPLWVDRPPHGMGEIKARARHLLKLIERAEYGEVPACDWAMWPCGFWELHDKSEGSVWAKKEAGTVGDEEERTLKRLVFDWRKAKGMVEKWKVKEGEAREEMARVLESAGAHKWSGGDAEVAYQEATVQRRFDLAAAKRDGVEVDKWMKETKVRAHVKVKEVKRNGDLGAS